MIGLRVLAGCGLALLLAGSARRRRPVGTDRPVRGRRAGRLSAASSRPDSVAAALGVQTLDLPTRGLGLVFGAHFYPLRSGVVTLGLGGEVIASRRRRHAGDRPTARPAPTVNTRFSAVVAADLAELRREAGLELHQRRARRGRLHDRARDRRRSPTPRTGSQVINYGGGARWFVNQHLAVSLDLRFYAVNAQDATRGPAGVPRRSMTHASVASSARESVVRSEVTARRVAVLGRFAAAAPFLEQPRGVAGDGVQRRLQPSARARGLRTI